MKSIPHTSDVAAAVGTRLTLRGFVHALRVQSKVIFIVLRDIRGTVQVVVVEGSPAFAEAKNLSLESVIAASGAVVAEKNAPGGVELHAEEIAVLSRSAPELPMPVVVKGGEETEAPIRLDYRWLDLRKPEKARIFKVWTELERGFRECWLKNGFLQVYPPSFMSTASETGAEVFEVNYFGGKAYLAQSPQFYKQMAIAAGFERVFMVGPVFRAEPSFTTRHLTEFTGWDFEMAYIDSHEDLLDAEEEMLVAGFEAVTRAFPDTGVDVPSRPFPRMTMAEVKRTLADAGVPSGEPHDLSSEEEKAIAERVRSERGHDFLFVTDYHRSKSAFYHMRRPDDPDRARRADLLYRGLEVTTLAQREHRIEILERQAKEKGMALPPLRDYLNFFRYGCPPHGGGGIGPGRLVMKMLGLPNVREATFVPRDVKRLNP